MNFLFSIGWFGNENRILAGFNFEGWIEFRLKFCRKKSQIFQFLILINLYFHFYSIRGSLGLMFTLMKCSGIIFSLILGSILKYFYVVWIFMLFPILFWISTQFWYESAFYKIESADEYVSIKKFIQSIKNSNTYVSVA